MKKEDVLSLYPNICYNHKRLTCYTPSKFQSYTDPRVQIRKIRSSLPCTTNTIRWPSFCSEPSFPFPPLHHSRDRRMLCCPVMCDWVYFVSSRSSQTPQSFALERSHGWETLAQWQVLGRKIVLVRHTDDLWLKASSVREVRHGLTIPYSRGFGCV